MDVVPDYDAALFVTPTEAYRRVLARVERWKGAQPGEPTTEKLWRARHHSSQTAPGDQVLGLVGERGVGKTWLLRHLAEDESRVSPAAVYLDLEDRTRFRKPDDYVRAVEAQMQRHGKDARSILLLDTLPPHLDEHLRALEDAILRPQLVQHGSLVIMALAHPLRVCWRMPALRGTERYVLQPFVESQTREQLRRLRKAGLATNGLKPSSLQAASGGLPLLNYLLATRARIASHEALLEHWLSYVPAVERDRVRSYLEAVCTLDTLEQAKIQRALEVYNRGQPQQARVPPHPGDVRNMLRKHWLARAVPESPGRIVLIDSVRRAAREVLQARDAELYAALEAMT
jgi:hypothetical protein